MIWHPHLTVATLIEKDGKYLCVRERAKRSGNIVINQPAGHVEAGETLVEAAIRETREETGYPVEIVDLTGIYTYTPPGQNPEEWMTYYRFCFRARLTGAAPDTRLDPDIIDTVWLTPEQLHQSEQLRSPLVLRCVQDAMAGKSYPLDLINEQYLHT